MIIKESNHKARKQYCCYSCHKIIFPGEKYFRLFGMDEDTDVKPYEIMECDFCNYDRKYKEKDSHERLTNDQ